MNTKNFLISIVLTVANLFSGCQGISAVKKYNVGLSSYKMYNAVFNDNVSLAKEALAMGENPNCFSSTDVSWLSPNLKRESNPFAMALYLDRYDVAEFLLDNGADVNALTAEGATLLQISSTNIEFARKLIDRGTDVNAENVKGNDLFDYILSHEDNENDLLEWVALCVENGYTITPEKVKQGFDENNSKPYEMIKYLREYIPDLKSVLSETDELFYKAAFEILGNDEADINIKNSRGESLINIAAKYGNVKNVELLYEKGANIRVRGNNGLYDALDYAIENGHTETVRYFVENGEQVIRRDDYLYSTTERNLINCAKGGYNDCLEYVLTSFEKAYDENDVTAAAREAIKAHNTELLELILNNYKCYIDELADECSVNGTTSAAQLLMEHGADFGKVDNALYYAINFHETNERKELTAFLITNYPELIESDTDALPTAISKGDIDCVKLLIENGININQKYYDKQKTALMFAADSTDEIFEYLLSAGADVSLRDAEGKTIQNYLSDNVCRDYNKETILTKYLSE